MDSKNQRRYTGHSGQMVVMAELLARGCNVAIPEIDVGEDVFAFQDGQRPVDRIQVKTATNVKRRKKGGHTADVHVKLAQLRDPNVPELYYVFPVRLEDRWTDFVVISRPDLYALHEIEGVGYKNEKEGDLQLHLIFGAGQALACSDLDLSGCRNAWERLPVLKLPPVLVGGVAEHSVEPGQGPGGELAPSSPPESQG